MSLLSICARDGRLTLNTPDGPSAEAALAARLATMPPSAPIVILVHGKGYCPGDPLRDAARLVFATRPGLARSRFVSWPRRLGFALPASRAERGLCIGFGWDARGTIWATSRRAAETATLLARLIQMIGRIAPNRPVDLFGHSLGARVILGAVPLLHAGALGRVILLAAAEFRPAARAALDSPAGAGAEFLNITTRENDLFDWLFERAHHPLGAKALGRGLRTRDNWLNIELDNPRTEAGLRALGLPLAHPAARICHWSVYLRPGVFRLYRALIHDRGRLTLSALRPAVDHTPRPHGTRLWAGAWMRPVPATASAGWRAGMAAMLSALLSARLRWPGRPIGDA